VWFGAEGFEGVWFGVEGYEGVWFRALGYEGVWFRAAGYEGVWFGPSALNPLNPEPCTLHYKAVAHRGAFNPEPEPR